MVQKATEMPEGQEKKVLIEALANMMKKQYLTWNREAVTDSSILKDLSELSEGKININAQDMKLSETRDILLKNKKNKKIISKKNKPHQNL